MILDFRSNDIFRYLKIDSWIDRNPVQQLHATTELGNVIFKQNMGFLLDTFDSFWYMDFYLEVTNDKLYYGSIIYRYKMIFFGTRKFRELNVWTHNIFYKFSKSP